MRLPTRKTNKGYLHKCYSLSKEKNGIVITELQPCREGYNLVFRPKTADFLSINNNTRELKFHGKSKNAIQTAEAISGFTFGLEDIIRPFGFRYTYIDGIWKKRAAVAS